MINNERWKSVYFCCSNKERKCNDFAVASRWRKVFAFVAVKKINNLIKKKFNKKNSFFEKFLVSSNWFYSNNFRWNKNVIFQKHKQIFEKESNNFEKKNDVFVFNFMLKSSNKNWKFFFFVYFYQINLKPQILSFLFQFEKRFFYQSNIQNFFYQNELIVDHFSKQNCQTLNLHFSTKFRK